MTITIQYEKLLKQLRVELPDLEKRVLTVLSSHPEGVTRRQLVREVHGVEPGVNLTADTYDRRNREAIRSLRKRLVPIVSNSGRRGYRINPTKKAVEEMIAEWESRIIEINQTVKAARKFYNIKAKQMSLGIGNGRKA